MNDIENGQLPSDGEQTSTKPAEEVTSALGSESATAKSEADAIIEALRAENADFRDKLLRSIAEMENLRRRTEKEKADTAKYAISEFGRDVISLGDNIRRAIESVPKDALAQDPALKTLAEGMEVTERELFKVFERHGIQRFDPKGEKFDPHVHDAMMRMETAEVPPETVYQVLHAGYMIGDRVLRPAAVIVAKAVSTAAAGSNGSSTLMEQLGERPARFKSEPATSTEPADMSPLYAEDGPQPEPEITDPQVVPLNRGQRTEAPGGNGAPQRPQILRQVNPTSGSPGAKRQSTMTRPVINRTSPQPKPIDSEPAADATLEEDSRD